MFTSPGEIAFKIFNYPVHWYGIIMALAICSGLWLVSAIRRKYYTDIPKDLVLDLSFYLIIAGVIGARLYYILLDGRYYFKHPFEIFAVWNGGLSIHGAIIAAIIAGIIYTKRNNYDFLRIADLFIYGLSLGQIIGRWGNFFNSEAYGIPTSLPWKLYIPINSRVIEFYNSEYFHPAFLYESLLNLIILLILIFVIPKFNKNRHGIIFFSYFILYAVVRFMIESIRIDSVLNVWGIPIAQLISVLFLIIGAVGILVVMNNPQKTD